METNVARQKLITARDQLLKELNTLGVQNQSNQADWIATPAAPVTTEPDPNDQGDRHEDWSERHATIETLEERLKNINRALEKIAAGSYGICEISGEPIEDDRLTANPAARTCKAHINDESKLTD